MALTGPWRQDQRDAGVGLRSDLAALLGLEVREEARTTADGLAALVDLDLAVGHHQVGALVGLVLLEQLARRQVDRDNPRLGIRAQHLRLARRNVERGDVPGLHASPQ